MRRSLNRWLKYGLGPRDPAYGLSYNKLIPSHSLSRDKYSFDIARTPQVVKDSFERMDVQKRISRINDDRRRIDRHLYRISRGES